MTDPRNKAHDQRVNQEKKHDHKEIAPGADETVQPGKKPHMAKQPKPVDMEPGGDDDIATPS